MNCWENINICSSHPIEIISSFDVLEIYFDQKSIEDKERILRDAGFGC